MKAIEDETKAALIAEITAAFDGVQREDGITLHEAQALDDYRAYDDPSHPARVEARAIDKETRWQDVPSEDIAEGYNVLSFIDAKGFRYYIPALLVWFLTSEEDSNTYDSVMHFLDEDYEEYDGLYLPHVSILNHAQSKAIAHFLVYEAAEIERYFFEEIQLMTTQLEEELQERIQNQTITPAGCADARLELRKRLTKYRQPNDAQSALDRYWGQFL